MTDDIFLRSLETRDAKYVRQWLSDWLECHIGEWANSYNLGWTTDEIKMRILNEGLVDREWCEISEAAHDSDRYVCVADVNGEPAGIVYAEWRMDRYLSLRQGVLSWIYVVPEARGHLLAANLLEKAHEWMRTLNLVVSEVFTTATNNSALRAYRRAGYQVVDHRMVAMLNQQDA